MAFGSKARQVSSYNEINGGKGSEIFFPSNSGEKGAAVERTFRMFADEDEVVYREWSGEVMVNGNKTFRSCVVAQDNYFDNVSRARLNEIKEAAAKANKSEEETKELIKAEGLKWTKQVFATNVINRETGQVQVLKGSYEPHIEDDAGNLIPKNKMGGKTIYSKLLSLIRTGARVQDPKNPRKAVVINDPSQFDIIIVTSGQNLGKKHDLHVGFVSEIEDTLLTLERRDLERWAKGYEVEGKMLPGTGVWPNEALEKLANGYDYYKLIEEYNIELYPPLRNAVAPKNAPVEIETDELFDD